MTVNLGLEKRIERIAVLLAGVFVVLLLSKMILANFVVGTLSDLRIAVDPNLLRQATTIFPPSGRVLTRLAEAETKGDKRNLDKAQIHAEQAVGLLPNDYKTYLFAATIFENRGDLNAAQRALSDAMNLAPSFSEVRWRLANVLLRTGETDRAEAEFKTAITMNPQMTTATLELLDRVTNRDLDVLKQVVKDNPAGQITLARYLGKQDRLDDAADVLSTVDRRAILASWEVPELIYLMMNKNHAVLARRIWTSLREPGLDENVRLIWNGSFESDHLPNFEHFEWHFTRNDYARISVDDTMSRSGSSSLLLDFLGRDTTRLDTEAKQQLALRPGRSYTAEYWVRTQNFQSPNGPRVVVTNNASAIVAASSAITSGTQDWRRVTFNINTPRTASGDMESLLVSIKQQPKFSYEEPTRGRIWFDDFTIYETPHK